MRKKDYPVAVAAFELALVLRPADPRAIFERGFARMMAGQNDLADEDFKTAAKRAYSASLKREILAAQATMARFDGDHELEQRLRTQAEASEKLRRQSDGGICDIDVSRPNIAALEAPGYAAAWKAILEAHAQASGQAIPDDPNAAGISLPMPVHASEEEARGTIVGKDIAGKRGWSISTGDMAEIHQHLVVAKGETLLVYPNVTTTLNGRCGDECEGPVFHPGPRPSITAVEEERSLSSLCAVSPDHCDPERDSTGCFLAGWNYITLILDPTTLAIVLKVVERMNPSAAGLVRRQRPKVSVTIGTDAVQISGCGANGREVLKQG